MIRQRSQSNTRQKTTVLAFLCAASASPTAYSQTWVAGSGGAIYYNGGNVGISANSPQAQLHVGNYATRQVMAGSWADMSSNACGPGTFAGNAYTTYDSTNGCRFLFSNTHASIGAIGFAVNYPSWNQASIISSGGTSSTGGTAFMPTALVTFGHNGNVGLGTTTPAAQLSLVRSDASQRLLSVFNSANSGGDGITATIHSDQPYSINTTPYTGAVLKVTAFPNGSANNQGDVLRIGTGGSGGDSFSSYMVVKAANGNVGLGTTNPTHKLSVNGTIRAKEVIVDTGWSDYVFNSGYRLRPLREVGEYIRANYRLPEIPSEEEVRAGGVSLGEMQSKLLAKIEELTLYLIRADERNERIEQQNRELQHQVRNLQALLREGEQ